MKDLTYQTEALEATQKAYADWKKQAQKIIGPERQETLMVSDADVMVKIIAGHILLARAHQAELDMCPETARFLRESI